MGFQICRPQKYRVPCHLKNLNLACVQNRIRLFNLHFGIWPCVPDIHVHVSCNAVTLVWGSLRLAPIMCQHSTCIHMSPFIQDNVTVSENCTNGQVQANYELSYNTESGTPITTCDVHGTQCSNGMMLCRHVLQNNTEDSMCQPPVSQFSGDGVTVSLTARNIVGRSNSAVSRIISELCEVN